MPPPSKQTRPAAVRSIAIVNGVIGALCLLAGFFLLYTAISATGGNFSVAAQCLIAILLVLGIVYALLANEFYNLRPWTYPIVRSMLRGTLSPLFSLWGLTDLIDSDDVRRAFGQKKKK